MKRKTLKIKNKKATIHIIAKTKEMKLAEQNYKPDVWYDGSEKHITETRSYWEEPHAVEDMFNGDLLLTVYIMHELRKGDKSFYSPFLSILPEPGNISEWNEEELAELQVIFSFLMLLKCYSK